MFKPLSPAPRVERLDHVSQSNRIHIPGQLNPISKRMNDLPCRTAFQQPPRYKHPSSTSGRCLSDGTMRIALPRHRKLFSPSVD